MSEEAKKTVSENPQESSQESGSNRRQFLKRGLFGSMLLGFGGLCAYQSSGYSVPAEILQRLKVLSGKEYLVLSAATERLLRAGDERGPSASKLGVATWIDGYLSRQSPWVQRDVKMLLNALEHSPPLMDRVFSRFSKASGEQQDAILDGWARSRLELRKQGFNALKGLSVMAFYRHPESWPEIGYGGPMVKNQRRGG